MDRGPQYSELQRYPAVVVDRRGRFETTLVNDGRRFELELRGNRFAGGALDGLELVGSPENAAEPPDLHEYGLCSCVIEWTMPIRVAHPGVAAAASDLVARLTLGDPTPRRGLDRVEVTLALHLATGVTTTSPHGYMEDALLDLRRRLPADVRLVACISCAFSDYNPAGSGFIGTMACFREVKDAYRSVDGKRGLFQVWNELSGFVQETFVCDDYEQRRPGAGYRGWPSHPAAPDVDPE